MKFQQDANTYSVASEKCKALVWESIERIGGQKQAEARRDLQTTVGKRRGDQRSEPECERMRENRTRASQQTLIGRGKRNRLPPPDVRLPAERAVL